MAEGRKLLEVLKAELTFLEQGGYRARATPGAQILLSKIPQPASTSRTWMSGGPARSARSLTSFQRIGARHAIRAATSL
jgi:hypothetical protein